MGHQGAVRKGWLPIERATIREGCEVVTDYARFLSLQQAWERLRARVPGFTFFQSHAWLSTWWEHNRDSRRLFVICRWSEGALAAAAPLCIARAGLVNTVQFMGGEDNDFGGFLLPTGGEHYADELWSVLHSHQREWALADLRYVPQHSLGQAPKQKLLRVQHLCQDQEANRFVDFAGAPWRTRVKKPMRHNVERQKRRLEEKGELLFEQALSPDEVIEYLEHLRRLHVSSWSARGETSNFCFPKYRAWIRTIALRARDAGNLYLCRLILDSQTIAVGLCFVEDGHLLLYTCAHSQEYASYSAMGVLTMCILDDMEARGVATLFDFGRGNEEYKARWTDTAEMLSRHLLVPDGVRGDFCYLLAGRVLPFLWRHHQLGKLPREAKRRLGLLLGRKPPASPPAEV